MVTAPLTLPRVVVVVVARWALATIFHDGGIKSCSPHPCTL
jgi:hypothetical protein